jgi:hypothetical protein
LWWNSRIGKEPAESHFRLLINQRAAEPNRNARGSNQKTRAKYSSLTRAGQKALVAERAPRVTASVAPMVAMRAE